MGDYETKQIFARKLSKLLADRGLTQAELAGIMGVAASSVSAWCSGDKMPRMDKVEWIAQYFNVMKTELLEDVSLPGNVVLIPKMKKVLSLTLAATLALSLLAGCGGDGVVAAGLDRGLFDGFHGLSLHADYQVGPALPGPGIRVLGGIIPPVVIFHKYVGVLSSTCTKPRLLPQNF